MAFLFDPQSSRSKRSRLAERYAANWMLISYKVIGATTLILGGALLYIDRPIGWLIFSITAVFATIYAWAKGDLQDNSFGSHTNEPIQVHELIEFPTLAKLHAENPSAYDVWTALVGSEEQYFISNRFLVDTSYFETFVSKNEGSASEIWQIAEELRQKHGLTSYPNTLLLTALVKSVPNHEQLLNSVKIDIEDIKKGILWMNDILEKRRLARAKQSFGGIGRDWAFGYTPLLRALGHNISRDIELNGFFSDTTTHVPLVENMTKMLASGNGTVTLVGDNGVGKTTCVHALAEHLLTNNNVPSDIQHNQVVSLDAPTLIANAKNPGQLEELVLRILNEAHKAKNVILFFDDAEVFFGIGSTIDLTHVIQPALEAHSVKIILAMTPRAWQQLSGTHAIGKMQPLNVLPPDREDCLAILRDSISLAEYRNKVVFTYQSIKEAYELGLRYATNQAMPGAALAILEQAATSSSQQLITREVLQGSVEQTYGIKLQSSDKVETDKLLNLESELHKSVINQDRAIRVVSDALRRARSGVGNPNRPVGTFLFLGPTGVGKTELSKALAKVYFGDERSLIRVDMNQYVSNNDVQRLIDAGSGQELGFLGQVRKQPFSVVLLDEIEKAHPSVVNALLQLLDEGIMQDSESRSVSFRDAIIIATSNAGAEGIRNMIDQNQDLDNAESVFIDSLISSGAFAPELINRFDEVVIFKPLSETELINVVDLILKDINKNLDSQKVHVELSQDAKIWLVQKGYDPKLGARPMRRMVQRYVENTIAKKLLDKSLQPGQTIVLEPTNFESQ